ncbi:MAG TPA: UbiA-like polyprenyltransferase [Chitinophagales bacterium]|nr:UbiA family prenyltransferase [Chitinophagales bacterium]HAE13221.1 4-hydroxybenzoate octaprenyltransferase [Bacteroidota bacterium]HAE35191.1 4-hydroxybenzoate octaprenyltransferase [Bacteroidota bacterium]HQU38903.1 UbiA-like polyprenyltransferase [Chitinophagales bacterium]HQU75694.1 UbiA-like polyprenyltransferase [Chitinophagales bacterium]
MRHYLSLIKFSHTVFALPFALIGFFLALQTLDGPFPWTDLLLVLGCMVFARSAAMAFNRYLDSDIDALNARTAVREIPKGVISRPQALIFVILNSIAFIVCAGLLNELCLYLSPVALLVILGYSYTKRFTWLCHFVLGLGLSLAPVGAWLALTGQFAWLPIVFGLIVLTWVSGFDILYALQDETFDREHHLHSVPEWLGRRKALSLSIIVHVLTAALVIVAGQIADGGTWYWIGAGFFTAMLIYQHMLVKPDDISRVNLAFATTNGMASVAFGILVIADILF